MPNQLWESCVSSLQNELPAQQFNTWIRPLRVEQSSTEMLKLKAPNRFVLDWVNDKFLGRIQELVNQDHTGPGFCKVEIVTAGQPQAFQNHWSGSASASRETIESREGLKEDGRAQRDAARVESVAPSRNDPLPDNSGSPSAYDKAAGTASSPVPDDVSSEASRHLDAPHQGGGGYFGNHMGAATTPEGGNRIQGNNFSQMNAMASELGGTAVPQGANAAVEGGQGVNPVQGTLGLGASDEGLAAFSGNHRGTHTIDHYGDDAQSFDRVAQMRAKKKDVEGGLGHKSNLNEHFTFANFVVGKSNQLGLAAASQVAENPGGAYNPLFIYGGVGLGKTHLMHAVGNALAQRKVGAKVVYLHSERFVADMVKALQLNAINDFKRFYRSVDALLIDDIQFFAGKERSQEEFFHTFNALLEGGQQIILTCDKYPKEISGLEERLKSRFGWGLTVAIEPPELETRVAILKRKAEQAKMELPNEAAFFIAQRVRSNVRELEGALKRVIANAHFTSRDISVELVREALKDLLALQDRLVSIDNIQRVVAEYYKIRVADLHSKRRSRSVARPRQVAMYLAKDLTHHSLPEIGEAFGGRDHTTVLHACRKIKELIAEDSDIAEDVKNLLRTLTT